MDILSVTEEDIRRGERDCWKFLREEVYPLLEWIPYEFDKPKQITDLYKLNEKGRLKYPQLANDKFRSSQLDNYVHQMGAQMNPFEFAIDYKHRKKS